MPERARKLKLGDNHRRALTVLLAGVEEACAELGVLLKRAPGRLVHVEDDLTSAQRQRLGELSDRLRCELSSVSEGILLDPVSKSRRRSIVALLTAQLIYLEETAASGMKGYGRLADDARQQISRELKRLMATLEEMISVVQQD
jgi:hypothetical protein